MKNKKIVVSLSCFVFMLGAGYVWHYSNQTSHSGHQVSKAQLSDDALLALIKNDEAAFARFIAAGGDLQSQLPAIDGKVYTVAEGISYFERTAFIEYLQKNKISFLKQNPQGDMLSLAVNKNNPELLNALLKENPDLGMVYGEKNQSLLHLASAGCSHKLADILGKTGKFSADSKQKDGATAVTLAANNDCLPMLSYFKEHNANFTQKDGRGESALSILKKNKDAAVSAFVASFETTARKPASAPQEVNFYKKRKIPKDQLADHTSLVEPEIRPLDAVETAEHSEFAD